MKQIDQERQMIRETAVKTAQRIQPRAAEIDTTGEIPPDLIDALGKQGLLSILLPEDFGGTHGDLTSFCLVVEEIAKVCGSSSLLILSQGVGALPILQAGSPSQQEQYFSQVAEKNSLIAFSLNEKGGSLEAANLLTRAEKQGSDYLLNGRKYFVTNGSIADLYTVFAVTHPGQGKDSLSAFVVEKGTPGLGFGKREEKIGMRGTVTSDVILQNCRIPEVTRLGREGGGWEIAWNALTMTGPAIGAQAVGISEGALDLAIRYAHERTQFGKSITSFQAIQFMIADMATQLEAARALVYKAVAHFDDRLEDREKLSEMAKCFATDVAMRITTDAVQLLGGYGYMRDYSLERMMRDAKVTQVYGGSNQIRRLALANALLQA